MMLLLLKNNIQGNISRNLISNNCLEIVNYGLYQVSDCIELLTLP